MDQNVCGYAQGAATMCTRRWLMNRNCSTYASPDMCTSTWKYQGGSDGSYKEDENLTIACGM